MPRFVNVTDPMRPLHDFKPVELPAGATVAQFIKAEKIDMTNRVCMVDAVAVAPEDWERPLHGDALAIIHPKVGAAVVAIILVAIVVSVALYFLIDIPKTPEESAERDASFSLRGQRNSIRFGQPVEKHYGKITHFPSYISKPFTQVVDNEQYLYALFCIGLGKYEMHNIKIEETPIDDFSEVTYQVYEPGEVVTMFPVNVQTSPEVSGIQLYGYNEKEFLDWSGPFTVCAADSKAYRIEIDYGFPQGLYKSSDSGPTTLTVEAAFEYRVLNEDETTGPWLPLTTIKAQSKEISALRYTIGVDVPKGRYQVRGKRLTETKTLYKFNDDLFWQGLRAFCEADQNFGEVTLLAVKARATNNLNDSSKNGFNVTVTSKVDVYNLEAETWTLTATRNPVWHALDVLRGKYGMRLPTRFLDMEKLCAMAADLDAQQVFFDYTFSDKGTVWNALQTVFARARAVPVASSGRIFAVRDVPLIYPTLGFSHENIIRDTFTIQSRLPQTTANDGIEVEYIEASTWKKKTVLCLFGNDAGDNPKQMTFAGCTNRQEAWRWGMYQRAVQVLQTDNITFETGLEGATAAFGDLIAIRHELLPVPHDVINTDSGRLADGAFSVEAGVTVIALPHAPTFEEFETHRIALRDKTGTIRGPFAVTAHADPMKVVLGVELVEADFEVSAGAENATYFFGVSGREYVLAKIVKIEPGGNASQIKITAVPYDEAIYQFDDDEVPPLSGPGDIPDELAYPALTGLDVVSVDADTVLATWDVAAGAQFYAVSKSSDGETFSVVGYPTEESLEISVAPGPLWVRVYAVNVGAGTPDNWNGVVGNAIAVPDAVTGIALIQDVASEIGVSWDVATDATGYTVKVYAGAFLISETVTSLTEATFDRQDLQDLGDTAGHVGTTGYEFTVEAVNSFGGSGESAPVAFDNLIVNDTPTEGNVVFTEIGKGLKFKKGSNSRIGRVTLVAGTASIANTTVTAETDVLIQRKAVGGTKGDLTYIVTPGVGFTIDSDSATDTSTVSFMLIEGFD